MRTRRFITDRISGRPVIRSTGGSVYGMIDWDGARILIVGSDLAAVTREAIRIFRRVNDQVSLIEDDPGFTDRCPIPEANDPLTAINIWLSALRKAAAVPSFDILDDEVVIAP